MNESKDPGTAATNGEIPKVFRAFVIGGILSVMTTGCLLGAVALLGISLHGSYTGTGWAPVIAAHANSQLYGWVGLFVIGFALRQHTPRLDRTRLYVRLAYVSLGLIAVAIPLRFLAEPLAELGAVWVRIGVASALMEALAVALFIANIILTRRTAQSPETSPWPWQGRYVYTALGWWMLAALAEPIAFAMSHQADQTASILFVAKWFVPYRDIQFLGFAANMIFGMGLARFSKDFGAPEADREIGSAAFWTWNIGLVLRAVGWIRYFDTGMSRDAIWVEFAGGVLLSVGAIQAAWASRIFSRLPARSAAHPFIRAGFAWLLFASLLWWVEPLHLFAIGAPFSHAYTGAIRHAVTVGFISQMIVGVSLGVLWAVRGRAQTAPKTLWWIFLLLNGGNALRVAAQIGTDYSKGAFQPMSVTGFVELAALTVWALTIVSTLRRPRDRAVCDHPIAQT